MQMLNLEPNLDQRLPFMTTIFNFIQIEIRHVVIILMPAAGCLQN